MADNEIKTKIRLEGEDEYQKALKSAYRELRVLRSELKAESAELGNNATAQEKARVKGESLKKQIAQQEKVVKTLESALKSSKEQYGENADVQAKWEEKLNKARETLALMKNGLDDASKALEDAGQSMKKAGQEIGQGTQTVVSFNDCLKTAGDLVKSIGSGLSGVFSASIESMKQMVDEMYAIMADAWSAAGDWKGIQNMFGGNLTDIQKVFGAAGIGGADAGTMTGWIRNLTKNVGSGNATTMAALQELGISVEDYGNYFDLFSDAIMKVSMHKGANQGDLSRALFGDGAEDVAARWQSLLATSNEIDAAGGFLSEDSVTALAGVEQSMAEISAMWDTLKIKFGEKLTMLLGVEGLTDGMQTLLLDLMTLFNDPSNADMRKKITLDISAIFEGIGTGIGNLSDWLSQTGKELSQSDDKFVSGIGKGMEALSRLLGWLADNIDSIISLLEKVLPAMMANYGVEAATGKGIGEWGESLVDFGMKIGELSLLKNAGGAAAAAGAGKGIMSGIGAGASKAAGAASSIFGSGSLATAGILALPTALGLAINGLADSLMKTEEYKTAGYLNNNAYAGRFSGWSSDARAAAMGWYEDRSDESYSRMAALAPEGEAAALLQLIQTYDKFGGSLEEDEGMAFFELFTPIENLTKAISNLMLGNGGLGAAAADEGIATAVAEAVKTGMKGVTCNVTVTVDGDGFTQSASTAMARGLGRFVGIN